MLINDVLAKMREGDVSALKTLFDKYGRQIYREALVSCKGDHKAAAKKVLDVFNAMNNIAKREQEAGDQKIAAVLSKAEQAEKIENACLNAVWSSLSNSFDENVKTQRAMANSAIANQSAWINGKKMETVSEHVAQVRVDEEQREKERLENPDGENDFENKIPSDLLLQAYPDDVIEGSEMEAKRKKVSKRSVLMLVVIVILIIFLLWSILGIILAVTPSTAHIDIGFGGFINGIKRLFGW